MAEKPVASTAAVPSEVTVSLRIATWGSACTFNGPTDVEQFLDELVEHPDYQSLHRRFLRAYRVPREIAKLRAAEKADTDAKAEEVGELLVPSVDTISAGDYILVVQLQQAAPSSTTGKCPHSIVFPSVARSSLCVSAVLLQAQKPKHTPAHRCDRFSRASVVNRCRRRQDSSRRCCDRSFRLLDG
jgi:hypothetical protein